MRDKEYEMVKAAGCGSSTPLDWKGQRQEPDRIPRRAGLADRGTEKTRARKEEELGQKDIRIGAQGKLKVPERSGLGNWYNVSFIHENI